MNILYQYFVLIYLSIIIFKRPWYSKLHYISNIYSILVRTVLFLSIYILPILIILGNTTLYMYNFGVSDTVRLISIIGLILTLLSINWIIKSLDQMYYDGSKPSRGPYKIIRHPIYTTWLQHSIFMLFLISNYLMVIPLALTLIAILVRIPIEDRVMMNKLGHVYEEYMEETKKLLPWFY